MSTKNANMVETICRDRLKIFDARDRYPVMNRNLMNRNPGSRFSRLLAIAVVVLSLLVAATLAPSVASAEARPDTASLQVERLYLAYFERAPEAAGHSYWTRQRLGGQSLASISQEFSRSDEFKATYGALSNEAFVTLVYDNVLDRTPDEPGLTHWTGQLNSGAMTRGEVMVGFSESLEFVLGLDHLDGDPVRRLYRAFFLREADADGLGYWWGRQIGGMSLVDIAQEFAVEAEFVARYGSLNDPEFVQLVYRNVLDRDPDAGGLAFWTDELASGRLNRGAVMVGFSESPEFSGNPAPVTGTTIGGCSLFPSNSFWYSSVADLPVLANSQAYVNRLGADKNAHPDFGAGLWNGSPIGIPYTVVPDRADDTAVSFTYGDESDASPYPVPADAPIEGGSDRHVLVVESGACVLHELFAVQWQGNGTIEAGSGARWDLSSNHMRPDSWTSGDAAGLPILPGLVRYDEVASGSINHANRFTANVTDDSFVWPASHFAGSDAADRPPMGSWIRLKASVNPDDFTGQARVIVDALQEHGAILADNGSSWLFSGVPDERWDNQDLRQLRDLNGDMFEFIDASSLQVEADSYAAN